MLGEINFSQRTRNVSMILWEVVSIILLAVAYQDDRYSLQSDPKVTMTTSTELTGDGRACLRHNHTIMRHEWSRLIPLIVGMTTTTIIHAFGWPIDDHSNKRMLICGCSSLHKRFALQYFESK